jgi:hypothetical protein
MRRITCPLFINSLARGEKRTAAEVRTHIWAQTVIFKQCYNLILELEYDILQGSVYHVDPTRIYKHSQYAIMKLHCWFACNVTDVLSSGPKQSLYITLRRGFGWSCGSGLLDNKRRDISLCVMYQRRFNRLHSGIYLNISPSVDILLPTKGRHSTRTHFFRIFILHLFLHFHNFRAVISFLPLSTKTVILVLSILFR